ncbi:hemolysin-III related-domain-containing protein [Mycena epipterygia]|nr:hemolysin-III related-domain-containing protein [Mycena epipterygia]
MATRVSRRGRRRRPSDATRPHASSGSSAYVASLFTMRLILLSYLVEIPHRLSLLAAAIPTAVFAHISRISLPARLQPLVPKRAVNVDEESRILYADPEVSSALKHSCAGHHLISYTDLPLAWRNNPFISTGYRFIPLDRYLTLIFSVFTLHNEFLNIQTHLLPLLLWGATFRATDPAECIFTACILICLGSSVIWHTMAGCAHHGTMEFCARVDYVGIGWLISASIGTIVYYGYAAYPHLAYAFLALCLLMAVAGSVLPFMAWFDRYENRLWRLAFFLALVFCAAAPIAGIALLHGLRAMSVLVAPILPTLASCAVGLVFYALHIPECFLTPAGKWQRRLESVGAGSHAIWHACIVLGMAQWRAALAPMRAGIVLAATA